MFTVTHKAIIYQIVTSYDKDLFKSAWPRVIFCISGVAVLKVSHAYKFSNLSVQL